jgi:hypothetical protein
LPFDATEESVRAFFSKQGDLSRPHRPMKLILGCFGGREDDRDSKSKPNGVRTLLSCCVCNRGKNSKGSNKEEDAVVVDDNESDGTSSSSSGLDEDCSEGDATDSGSCWCVWAAWASSLPMLIHLVLLSPLWEIWVYQMSSVLMDWLWQPGRLSKQSTL